MRLPQKCFEEHVQLEAKAKVNLRLRVTGRRGDGYHLLSMINNTCSLADALRIRLRRSPEISVSMNCEGLCRGESVEMPSPSDNLVARAVSSFGSEFSLSLGADISVEKRIPLGAGLGGGSGDAAAVLRYLALQCGLSLSDERLLRIAVRLGADVPYMLRGGLARLQGIGEIIEPIDSDPLRGTVVALVFPDFGISSAHIFSALRKIDSSSFVPDRELGQLLSGKPGGSPLVREDFLRLIKNDLTPIAGECFPAMREIVARLESEPDWIVSMTGSGSTLFVIPGASVPEAELRLNLSRRLVGVNAAVEVVTLD